MKVAYKQRLDIGNRDGDLFVVETTDGEYYLVLEADSLRREEVFEGMGNCEWLQISESAFELLTQ